MKLVENDNWKTEDRRQKTEEYMKIYYMPIFDDFIQFFDLVY